jgi:hypothetical protein
VSFGPPVKFVFPEYIDAATSAAYETIAIRLTAPGTVEHGECATCDSERYFLRIDETEQLFELVGDDFEVGEHIEEEYVVRGWEGAHSQLVVPAR